MAVQTVCHADRALSGHQLDANNRGVLPEILHNLSVYIALEIVPGFENAMESFWYTLLTSVSPPTGPSKSLSKFSHAKCSATLRKLLHVFNLYNHPCIVKPPIYSCTNYLL